MILGLLYELTIAMNGFPLVRPRWAQFDIVSCDAVTEIRRWLDRSFSSIARFEPIAFQAISFERQRAAGPIHTSLGQRPRLSVYRMPEG